MERPDPIPELKRQVARELKRAMDGWETPELCYLMRTGQPRVSNLRAGRIERFSLEQLIRFLARLSHTVELSVHEVRVERKVAPRSRRVEPSAGTDEAVPPRKAPGPDGA